MKGEGREVTEVGGDVSTRHQCLVFGGTNLLRNVCSVHSYTVVLSIIITDTSPHGWRDGPSSVGFSLEVLVRKFFTDDLLVADAKRSGKLLSLMF